MRKVFFSFHYQRDIHRVNYIRSPEYYAGGYELAGFWDGSIEETHPTYNEYEIKELINETLHGTSVTVVLIGRYTFQRPWVIYEIQQSFRRKNGLLGIYIHKLRDKKERTDNKGDNPFYYVRNDWNKPLSYSIPTYDWFDDEAKYNIGDWIEKAAQRVRR
ncbi:MAG: TIR domain-containing protein [Promethearchaeota archaeon]